MYYGAGLLSTIDRYPERRVSHPVPAPSSRGRRGRPAERGSARGMPKAKRGRVKESRGFNDGSDAVCVILSASFLCHLWIKYILYIK